MALTLTILRIIHIFSGVAWIGIAFTNIAFLQPAIRATGQEGQAVMGHLVGRTRFLATSYTVATLSLLSGLILYAILSQFRWSYVISPYGLAIGIGGISGLVGWILVMFVLRGILNRMQALGAEVRAQGGPPNPEQAAELGSLSARLNSIGQLGLVLIAVALLGMSGAQYLGGI